MAIQISTAEFERLRDYMYTHFGINLAKKRVLVEGRLGAYLERKGCSSLDNYLDTVAKDPKGEEVKRLVERLTTNYTYFLREKPHYDFMQQTGLPALLTKIRDKDLRVWSAGCSSGEEPYTTSMVISEFLGPQRTGWDTSLLATDISTSVLDTARRGLYEEEKLQNLPEAWRKKYFTKVSDGEYSVTDALKKNVVFATFNLMEPTMPFRKKFHIIFCRNVMIYFDTQTKEALLNRFYQVLEPGGYMFIGLSETMANMKTPFHYIKPSIYQKKE